MTQAVELSNTPSTEPASYSALVDDKLYAVGGSVIVDRRLSWYGSEHQGRYVPFNTYILKDTKDVLLLESGVPATFKSAAAQLQAILGAGTETPRLAVTRNEPDCVANVPHLVRQFGLKTVRSPGLMNTLQFFRDDVGAESSFQHRSTELQMLNFGIGCTPSVPGGEVQVSSNRTLEIVAVPLKVLPTVWYYDRTTKAMFCSDTFSDESAASCETRISSSVDDREALVSRCRNHFYGKLDWLMRGDISTVISDLEAIFDRYEVEILAPNRGVVTQGKGAVGAKMGALLSALRSL